jgi:hypothetical protein
MADFLVENNVLQGTATPDTPVISNPIYEPRAVFSINASNQLQGTIWIVKNGQLVTSSLGSASYTVYDKDGATVGITESGLTADVNSQYQITPVDATAIQDLTHYVVKITIDLDSANRISYVGITLGE